MRRKIAVSIFDSRCDSSRPPASAVWASATGWLSAGAERRRLAPRELLERQPQRLGVGELAVEQAERHPQRAELGVRELDRRQVEVLRRQRVALRLVRAVGRLVHLQVDAERLELGAVGVEAARERVVVHARVALDLLLDLERRDRAPLGHQERDQRELPDELFGVLCHWRPSIRTGKRTPERPLCDGRVRFSALCGLARPRRGARSTPSRRARGRSATSARRPPSDFSSRSKLPSLPPRLSIACTSVASRVHGTTGLPCSSEPWWERMMWSTASAVSAREAGDLLDLAPDDVVAERDLALELAGVGEVDRVALHRVRLDLADVVQQRAGDRDVAVEPGEGGGHRADALGDRQAVLEQPVAVGLVVVLGRRPDAPALPDPAVGREAAVEQLRAGAGTGRCRSARAGRPPSARHGTGAHSCRSCGSNSSSPAVRTRAHA